MPTQLREGPWPFGNLIEGNIFTAHVKSTQGVRCTRVTFYPASVLFSRYREGASDGFVLFFHAAPVSKQMGAEGPEEDELVIDINYLWMAPLSSPMLDFTLKQFYIDYTFLEYFGENMETKSVHRSEIIDNKLHFNYSKIDKSTHGDQHNLLAEMFNKSTSGREACKIRFVVVSEPLEEDSSMQDCGEIGSAALDMMEVLNCDGNWANIDIAVINYNGDMIGTLNINIGGINSIKKVARELNILK
uniref:RPGRIP1 C-terminal domain-containing protein n=1 Tax=Timema monikensis TaxID=170555 RepID=A0A7R9EFR8_9NEOP|nr:unnamed protein product [Timema monikensis]